MAYDFSKWKKGDPIKYKREIAPAFSFVPPKGTMREELVPDTVDLAEMARLSVNCMTSVTDPDADYEIYHWLFFGGKKPYMIHNVSDLGVMKFQESLPLMRIMSGSVQNVEVEKKWMECLLKSIGDDGHIYLCNVGRPWNEIMIGVAVSLNLPDEARNKGEFGICPTYSGRLLSAMMLYYLRSGEALWRDAALRQVDALAACAVHKDGYAYFSPTPYIVLEGSTSDPKDLDETIAIEARHALLGCLHVYRELKYAPALEFARELLVYLFDVMKVIAEDGEFRAVSQTLNAHEDYFGTETHFHAHTAVMHCGLEYFLLTGDDRYLQRVVKGYDYGKKQGEKLIGYFPETLKSRIYKEVETCELADMIAIGVKLSEAGIRDCYNDVDLWLRNMGREAQLTPDKVVAINKNAETMPYTVEAQPNFEFDRAVERNVGAFVGMARPNDFIRKLRLPSQCLVMHCCTGNMTRALYYAWEAAVRMLGGVMDVNLLMNISNRHAEIRSYVPFSGRVEMTIKADCTLRLRLPDWADKAGSHVEVNGTKKACSVDGNYLVAGGIRKGDGVVLDMPIREYSKSTWMEKELYHVTFRGNDVVDIQPKGAICPLFNRGHYASGEVSYKKVSRFTPSEDIYW